MAKYHILYIFVIICTLLFAINSALNSAALKHDLGVVKGVYNKEHQEFTTVVNQLGEKISVQEAVILESKTAENQLIKENSTLTKRIKFLQSVVNIGTTIKVDTILVELPQDTIYSTTSFDSLIKVPKFYNISNDWYKANLYLSKKDIKIVNLTFIDTFTIVQGVYKKGLFKSSTNIVVRSKNPYTTISNMNSVVITKHKKGFVIGLGVGILTSILTYHYIK